MQVAQAFPVIVYEHKEDSTRRIMDIAECLVDEYGNRTYRTLFRYVIEKNEIIDENAHRESGGLPFWGLFSPFLHRLSV